MERTSCLTSSIFVIFCSISNLLQIVASLQPYSKVKSEESFLIISLFYLLILSDSRSFFSSLFFAILKLYF